MNITIPRETFDQMQEAYPDGEPNWLPTCDAGKKLHEAEAAFISAALSAAKAVSGLTNRYAEQPRAQGEALQGLAAYLRCEAGGVFVGSPNHETLMQWAREVDAVRRPQASEPACDRAYLNGLRAGFGYGISGDEAGYQKSANSYRAMLAAAPEATK